jgi:hypothetical protein
VKTKKFLTQARSGKPIIFRRWLFDELRTSWNIILHDVMNFELVNEPDVIGWKLGKSNKFRVKSVYNGLAKSDTGMFHKRIWKGKIPTKIKNFLWLMANVSILTKDNLRKRNCVGTISHLFFFLTIAHNHIFH